MFRSGFGNQYTLKGAFYKTDGSRVSGQYLCGDFILCGKEGIQVSGQTKGGVVVSSGGGNLFLRTLYFQLTAFYFRSESERIFINLIDLFRFADAESLWQFRYFHRDILFHIQLENDFQTQVGQVQLVLNLRNGQVFTGQLCINIQQRFFCGGTCGNKAFGAIILLLCTGTLVLCLQVLFICIHDIQEGGQDLQLYVVFQRFLI